MVNLILLAQLDNLIEDCSNFEFGWVKLYQCLPNLSGLKLKEAKDSLEQSIDLDVHIYFKLDELELHLQSTGGSNVD